MIDTGLQPACMNALDEWLAAERLRTVAGAGPATVTSEGGEESCMLGGKAAGGFIANQERS